MRASRRAQPTGAEAATEARLVSALTQSALACESQRSFNSGSVRRRRASAHLAHLDGSRPSAWQSVPGGLLVEPMTWRQGWAGGRRRRQAAAAKYIDAFLVNIHWEAVDRCGALARRLSAEPAQLRVSRWPHSPVSLDEAGRSGGSVRNQHPRSSNAGRAKRRGESSVLGILQPQLGDLAVHGTAIDAQDLRGQGFVAMGLLEHALQVLDLELL